MIDFIVIISIAKGRYYAEEDSYNVQANNAKEASEKAFDIALRCHDRYQLTVIAVYKKTTYKPSKRKGY